MGATTTTNTPAATKESTEATTLETAKTATNTSTTLTWKEKLITDEDAFHHHKIIGVCVLIIIAVRFCLVGPERDMGFRSHPHWTFPTLVMHFLLNASSIQFRIPKQRIKDGGRIWPEYRLHAWCFAFRSIVTIAVYRLEEIYGWEPMYDVNYLIVIGGMILADLASWSVGKKYQSRSVRDIDTHPAAKFFFSFMQFNANAGLLFGLRRYSMPFLIIFVTQTTPFMATLRRKHIFTSAFGGAFLYGAMLVVSFGITQMDLWNAGPATFAVVRTLGQLAALQRMSPFCPRVLAPYLQNKYVVWTTMFVLLKYGIRPRMETMDIMYLKLAWAVSFLACLYVGYQKTIQELHPEKKIKSV